MRKNRRHSLKSRLTLLFSSGMLVLVLFLSIFIFFSTSNLVYQHEQKLLNQKATAIASDLETEINEEASLRVTYLTRLLTNYADVNQFIILTDQSGKQLASIQGANWNKEPQDFYERTLVARESVQLPFDSELLFVQITTTTEALEWYFSILLTIILLSSFFTLLLSGIGGYLLSKWGLKPLDQLIQQIHSIFPKQLTQRIHHHHVESEINELINAFNLLLDRMEEALVSQQQFVTDASHELRTPLAIIEGYVHLLQRWGKNKPEVREEALAALSQECKRLFKLIDDLLSLAKLQDASYLGSAKVVQPLTPLLLEVKQAWLPIFPDQIKLSFEWEESLSLLMDRERIRQLLDILLDNARKYTDEGQVRVRAYRDGRWVHIHVEDTGIGILEKEIPHLFKRFYRVDKSRTRKRGGNGIGLAIAQAIVEDHDGSITVIPSSQQGLCVQVLLKITDDEQSDS
ncbi:sensor histidine kinase [Brevibacillus choshinensis]|uniref:histidine kinase n=1 Tax=Brevibacillus choshinensis TaxID=54911 RepID=A0ABX7FJQ9_BRECH|nr:ATP-binding protein [Brevibacillus choshinensis]QRG65571.1 HAMP domain-containing histidine kinase [Brevibacillus choshinensis]